MKTRPIHWGTRKGTVLKAIIIENAKYWIEIQEITGFSQDLLNKILSELYDDRILKKDYDGSYWIIPEVYRSYRAFSDGPLKIKEGDDKSKKVFVVRGRNRKARDALFAFLRSIKLEPFEFTEVIPEIRKGTPYIGEVLDKAFSLAQAIVVLMTPDDEARLREHLREPEEHPYEKELTFQARPNILFEAGMAMGKNPDHTILIELGKIRPFSDISGRHLVKLNDSIEKRHDLAMRLKSVGCPISLEGDDWRTAGDFELQEIGSTSFTTPLVEVTTSKSAHDKLIVEQTCSIWRAKLNNPNKILNIQRDGEKLQIDFSPFIENPHISYFVSHLKTGYQPLWETILRWKNSYSKLVERTTNLAERTHRFVEQPEILPQYNRLRPADEHINYAGFVMTYFYALWMEFEGFIQFETRIEESISGNVKWYRLVMAKAARGEFGFSPNREKILKLQRRVEEFHNDQQVFNDFKDVYNKGKELNDQLDNILKDLEQIWAEVENNVPLEGYCEAGVKGKFESAS